MKKSYILILTNLVLIWIISNRYPKIELFVFLKLSIPIIVFLLLGSFITIKLKKELFRKVFFTQNLISTIVISILTYAVIQGQIDKTEMRFNPRIVHENQRKVENVVKSYITENALYPNSYEPIEFGNLDAMELKSLKPEKDSTIIEKLNEEPKETQNYFLRHSYKLMDFEGDLILCVADIEVTGDFKISNIFNEDDFGITTWERRYGK